MLIGSKSRFAVEFAPVEDGNVIMPSCHFTYWIGDHEIGNFNHEGSTDDILEELRQFLTMSNDRVNLGLFDASANEIVQVINAGLAESENNSFNWRAYSITYSMGHGYPSHVGSRYDVYLVESTAAARIVVSNSDTNRVVLEKLLKRGEVDGILKRLWLSLTS